MFGVVGAAAAVLTVSAVAVTVAVVFTVAVVLGGAASGENLEPVELVLGAR